MENELLYKAVTLQKESQETENKLDFVNEQIKELENFHEDLKFLEKNGKKEILASLGKGVYLKTSLEEKNELFVDVGADVIVKKSLEETRKVIKEQINKFKEARIQLMHHLENYRSEFGKMLKEIEKMKEIESLKKKEKKS